MQSARVSLFMFACVFGGALLGIALRAVLPEHHRSSETRDVVKLGMGLVATMVALVLGLLVASAKTSYDTQNAELMQLSAKIALLDRVLAFYGPEARESRDLLRKSVAAYVDQRWASDTAVSAAVGQPSAANEALYNQVQGLVPKDDRQRTLHDQAVAIVLEIGQTRWLMFEQGATAPSMPMLIVLVIWLAIIFLSFGLHAPPNAMVVGSLFVAALSVSGAIFLILEMYTPYEGLIKISSAPLQTVLSHLGK